MKIKKGNKVIIIEKGIIKNIKNLENKKEVVFPGFIDSHTHIIHEGLNIVFPDLYETESLDSALEKLKSFEFKETNFILGINFDESKWKIKKLPEKKDLDKVSRNKIVVLRRICGHLAVTNTKGIEYFSKFGKVDYKTGIMREKIPLRLFSILKIPEDFFLFSLEKAQEKALSQGITCVHEMVGKRGFYYFLKLKEKGKLKIRVRYYLPVNFIKEIDRLGLLKGFGDEKLKFMGIKIFTDGSIGAEKAALTFNYRNSKKRGEMLISEKKFKEILLFCEKRGIQLAIHAIGDRAIKNIYNWGKKVIKKTGLRHRIEHAEMITVEIAEKLKEMGFTLSMQPNFIKNWQLKGGMYEQKLGEKWIYKMNPIGSLIKTGIKIGFGSDCMPLSPLYGVKSLEYHPSEKERIDFSQGIKLYTKGSAYLSFDEEKLGKLHKNYWADFILIEKEKIKEVYIMGKRII